jgi:putative heme degradation protein
MRVYGEHAEFLKDMRADGFEVSALDLCPMLDASAQAKWRAYLALSKKRARDMAGVLPVSEEAIACYARRNGMSRVEWSELADVVEALDDVLLAKPDEHAGA